MRTALIVMPTAIVTTNTLYVHSPYVLCTLFYLSALVCQNTHIPKMDESSNHAACRAVLAILELLSKMQDPAFWVRTFSIY